MANNKLKKRVEESTRKPQDETKGLIAHLENQENDDKQKADKKENKSQSATFLLRPTVYRDAKELATLLDTSVNDVINKALEDFVDSNRELLDNYRAFRATISPKK